jgi:hypothetical protein
MLRNQVRAEGASASEAVIGNYPEALFDAEVARCPVIGGTVVKKTFRTNPNDCHKPAFMWEAKEPTSFEWVRTIVGHIRAKSA